jgi:hypothetical protein
MATIQLPLDSPINGEILHLARKPLELEGVPVSVTPLDPPASAFPECWAGRLLHQLFRGLLGVTARSACKTRRVA